QRPSGSAPVVRARAEDLPFADGAFDASMAVLSDHHWADRARGLQEMRRVARRRAVVFTWDPARVEDAWLVRDFLPGFRRLPGMALQEIAAHVGATEVQVVPIPADCRDGFFHAYWARPAAYLDPVVRNNISVFARLDTAEVGVAVRDRQHDRLHRRQPHRELAGVVLDEDPDEAFEGAEERPVDHHGPVLGVVGAGVVQLEAIRHLVVELDGPELPRASDGVGH